MITYLNFVSIGQYEIVEGVENGRPFLNAVSEQIPTAERQQMLAALARSGELISIMERTFGPYPFTEFGGIVPAHDLWFGGLETQPRPIYHRQAILRPGFGQELIMHELAHMWYGNHVTLAQWDDIFLNESYATWAQWLLREESRGRPAQESFLALFDRVADDPGFWRITMTDPGPEELFGAVYQRGPMTLQALRNVVGDDAFFRLAKDWAAAPGPRSLADWRRAAQSVTTINLDPFFAAWLDASTVPERTPENGFR